MHYLWTQALKIGAKEITALVMLLATPVLVPLYLVGAAYAIAFMELACIYALLGTCYLILTKKWKDARTNIAAAWQNFPHFCDCYIGEGLIVFFQCFFLTFPGRVYRRMLKEIELLP